VANISLALWGKVAVNLNYTANQASMDSAVQQSGLKKVVTAQKALMRLPVKPSNAELIKLEELAKTITPADKLWAYSVARFVPEAALSSFLPGFRDEDLSKPATIIFTSGSTGDPKGVVLTQGNVLSNVFQIKSHIELIDDEVVLGILPLFHSFGYTVTLWTVLCLGFKGVYHHNPLEGKTVAKLCLENRATILFGSPTFVRGYLKKGEPGSFSSIRLLVLGAEKLKPELAEQIKRDMGIVPLEGYGCTETGPVVAVNVPHKMKSSSGQTVDGNRPGTVGLPVPGTAVKTIHPETKEDLPPGVEGVVAVKGPQIMPGYLNRPEATAKVLVDGWYETGDLGMVDTDGFLRITDRLSRFSKIGGEMVPHLAIETAVQEVAGIEEPCVAVTAIPDPKRGERLVVLHTQALGKSGAAVCQELAGKGLPNLWRPGPDDFLQVDSLPVLGTGKLDLKRMREIAEERLGTS
jgi:acyl-[acyl-carrier-protein]-phospholipid O-acyltransferase/long-chain-fatty-acid--[acyl-carrier-protein] ligase